MKAQVKVSPQLIVEVEGDKQKDLFKAIASAYEVFGEKKCGLCGSTDIAPAWRTVTVVKGKKTEQYDYPEFHCLAQVNGRRCGARLALGTINDDTGTIYPNRKLKEDGQPVTKADREAGVEGKYGAHRGWHRFDAKKDKDSGGE